MVLKKIVDVRQVVMPQCSQDIHSLPVDRSLPDAFSCIKTEHSFLHPVHQPCHHPDDESLWFWLAMGFGLSLILNLLILWLRLSEPSSQLL